jgi:tetratricopeptide (TPR) repeat protein
MDAAKEAAEALEAAATAYRVTEHQVDAWLQAAILWQDRVNDQERAIRALEEATERDVTHADAFERLHSIYLARGETSKLAELLERRLARTTDPDERVGIEVMRGRALAGVGEKQAAKQALAGALDANPDHAGALEAFAELCVEEGDWSGAEGAWIRLARHVGSPERQVDIYKKLGALYDDQLPNPERAELAYQEVLKRKPEDVQARERLVLVYGRLGRADKATELQQSLIEQATSSEQERDRTLELALVHEQVANDPKKAREILDRARKKYGHDARVLRALAEYYQRQGDDRAMNMLLDRSANDSRRALSTGRFEPGFFEVLATVSELRGASDSARVARATLGALEGRDSELMGAGTRAGDARLEDLLAPSALSTPLRHLLKKAGDVLDAAYPVDLRALNAQPLSSQTNQFAGHVEQVASTFGINGIGVFVSPAIGPTCMPVCSSPPRIVYGQALLETEHDVARYFLLVRALKILQAGAATLARTAPVDLWPLIAGFLSLLAPSWTPQGADPKKTAMAVQRLRAAMTIELDGDVPVLALEVIGAIGNRASQLATATHQFGNRAGLLAVGNPSAAIEGIALASGQGKAMPESGPDRLKWIVRNPEARDVAVFSVSDQYAQARASLGLNEQ